MRNRRECVFVSFVISCALAGCQLATGTSTDPAAEETVTETLSSAPSCVTVCNCPTGWDMCVNGQCANGGVVGPLPPLDLWCGATCQCAGATGCKPGAPGVCVSATMTASQNPVIVPAGSTTSTFTLTWDAPGYNTVDLWGVQNLESPGQDIFLGSGPTSGSALEPISVGEVATLTLYKHGGKSTLLATLHITGQH